MTAWDLLQPGDTALVLRAADKYQINPVGISRSGEWALSAKRTVAKVILYIFDPQTPLTGNIYMGDFAGREPAPIDSDKQVVLLAAAQPHGPTDAPWQTFAGPGRNARRYISL